MDLLTDKLMTYSSTEQVVNLLLSVVIGIILSVVYKSTHKGLSYSQSFAQTIVFVTVIVAIVMMVIGGSLARAFALVGALSIIRFRTVLKDTKDMSFIFGALAVGMAAGTSNYFLATLGTIGISLLAIFLDQTNFGAVYKSEFILRFRFDNKGDTASYIEIIKELCKRSNLLHMEPSADGQSLSLTYDIALRDDSNTKEIVQQFGNLEHTSEIVLIASKNDVDY
jgi:hypothetical protein